MTFTQAIETCFIKYADFSGRATRSEFWYWNLFDFLVQVVIAIIIGAIGYGNILSVLFSLATLLPSIAVGARRLHDTDHSGYWLLIGFVPLLGFIALLLLFCIKGTTGPNRFGTDPLAPLAA